MRVLVASTAGAGHFGPLVPFARAFVDAGHEVRVAAPASFATSVAAAGFVHEPVADADPSEIGAVFGRLMGQPLEDGDAVVVQEVFGRLDARAALPGMRRVLAAWRPELMIREPAEVASYVAAEEVGLPHITVNLGLDEQDDLLFRLLEEPLTELGCPAGSAGMAAAPRWTLLPASFDVVGGSAEHALARFREPVAAARPLPEAWWADEGAPLVYCTFGSVAASMPLFPGFYRQVVDELADLPVRVLLTIGAEADPAALGTLPPSVHVEPYWPQRDVLPHASVAVGHGGFGTTLGAMVAGLPQVALPLFSFDQFENARRIAEVGVGVALLDDPSTRPVAGVVLQHGPAAAAGLGAAVTQLLADEVIRAQAVALAGEVAALPPVTDCPASAVTRGRAPRARPPARC